jgi:membrane dipeptidase
MPADNAFLAHTSRLGVPREAAELYADCDVIDLHVDTFIWTRIFRYDITRRHGRGPFGARFFYQADVPRLREARVTGGLWSITTNPLRLASGRHRVFSRNLARLEAELARSPDVRVCRTLADYRLARAGDKHAAFVAVQGGNAFDGTDDVGALIGDRVLRVTLVHLTRSSIGTSSAPGSRGRPDEGLTPRGRRLVEQLDAARTFVDLAHVSRRGFFDAVDAHDKRLPLIVTHTGVSGVHPHWRNLDDAQIRAIADTGGVVGVMYQSSFLGDPWLGGKAERVVEHLEHIARVAGDDVPALGSDWDGMILPPRDMPTCLELPRLVEIMLRRGWSEARVRKALGGNFLASLGRLRG